MTTIDNAAAKERLESERANLVHQLHELGATEKGELTGDVDFGGAFADAGAATAERTEVLGLVDSLKTSLDDVDAALAKIERGTYGICTQCGNKISDARLEFRPASVRCVTCKDKSGG